MEHVEDVKFCPLPNSIYLKPLRMTYKQNGKEKSWDLMEMHDGVAIIIYNITRNVLVFVKQFRPGVYYVNIPEELRNKPIDMNKYPAKLGITTELCAGIVDKNKSLAEIAKEEVLEECGYDVPLENFEKLHAYSANVGCSGAVLTMYYCEVTDDMKVSAGGGVEDEIIDVIEMTVDEFKKYCYQDAIKSPGSVLVALHWFLLNKNVKKNSYV